MSRGSVVTFEPGIAFLAFVTAVISLITAVLTFIDKHGHKFDEGDLPIIAAVTVGGALGLVVVLRPDLIAEFIRLLLPALKGQVLAL